MGIDNRYVELVNVFLCKTSADCIDSILTENLNKPWDRIMGGSSEALGNVFDGYFSRLERDWVQQINNMMNE